MSEEFRGEYYQKVDSKARVSIPAAFRRVLEAEDPPSPDFPRTRVTMVYGGDTRKYVECFTQVGANRIARMVRKLPLGTARRELAQRDLISRSTVIEIDDDGRIVLPLKVREKIGFQEGDGEIAIAGTLDSFRIWHRDQYVSKVETIVVPELQEGEDVMSLLSDLDPED